MSFVYEQPLNNPVDFTRRGVVGGGVATGDELSQASFDSALYTNNTFASMAALNEAYDRRVDLVFQHTGRQLVSPERDARMADPDDPIFGGVRMGFEKRQARLNEVFNEKLAAIAAEFPEVEAQFELTRPVERDAEAIAREADERLSKFMASRSDFFGKWASVLTGGIMGSLHDPLQVATIGVGFGPATARTVGGRILQTAVREMAINGTVEAAMQPFVQKWRKQAGLEHGLNEAMANIGMASLFGGAFGVAGRGTIEGVNRIFNPQQVEAIAAELGRNSKVDKTLRAALAGDEQAAASSLATIRKSLPADVRGAVDQFIGPVQPVPKQVNPDIHANNLQVAQRAALANEVPQFQIDERQLSRLVDGEMQQTSQMSKSPGEESLLEFIAGAGGVKDQAGELSFMGATDTSIPFKGRLVKENGRNLDAMREMVAEAGYLDRLYGNPEKAMEKSTTADLLDLIDSEMSGQKVWPGHLPPERIFDLDAEENALSDHFSQIIQATGPGLDDEVYRAVSRVMQEQFIDVDEAVERVMLDMPEPVIKGERTGDPLPGWSDEELLAVSERFERERSQGAPVREPFENDVEFDPADYPDFENMEVPGIDGEMVTLAELNRQAGRDSELGQILELCNVA